MNAREDDLYNALKEIYTRCLDGKPCTNCTSPYFKPDYKRWHYEIREIARKQLMKRYSSQKEKTNA